MLRGEEESNTFTHYSVLSGTVLSGTIQIICNLKNCFTFYLLWGDIEMLGWFGFQAIPIWPCPVAILATGRRYKRRCFVIKRKGYRISEEPIAASPMPRPRRCRRSRSIWRSIRWPSDVSLSCCCVWQKNGRRLGVGTAVRNFWGNCASHSPQGSSHRTFHLNRTPRPLLANNTNC